MTEDRESAEPDPNSDAIDTLIQYHRVFNTDENPIPFLRFLDASQMLPDREGFSHRDSVLVDLAHVLNGMSGFFVLVDYEDAGKRERLGVNDFEQFLLEATTEQLEWFKENGKVGILVTDLGQKVIERIKKIDTPTDDDLSNIADLVNQLFDGAAEVPAQADEAFERAQTQLTENRVVQPLTVKDLEKYNPIK